ncbi:MAG: 2-hydroxyacyl-CoA dehydratase [Lachnospiraceae bacterium]|nr:2-hydroxyacyl-CoA dehydratase [Lachnospiraceae bacterium]
MGEINKGVTEQMKHLEFTRDVVHSYSKGVKRVINLALNYVYDMEAEGVSGRRNVIWAGGLAESPLFYACGATPLALSELGRLGSADAMQIAENDFQMPREACSMVKVLTGEYFLRKDSTVKRILFRGNACEPINMCAELMTKYGYDFRVLDTGFASPDMTPERKQALIDNFKREVEDAAVWISGKPLDKARLREEMNRYNRSMRKVRTIMNLRREHNTYIRSLPAMFIILGSTHYFGRYDEYMEALDMIIEEMSLLAPGDYNDDSLVRLVWSGGRGMEFGVYEAIDDAGACIMGWNLLNTFETGFSEDPEKDPLDAFVEYQVGGKNSGSVEDSFRAMDVQIRKSNAVGIILYGYVGCSMGSIMFELQREHYRKRGISAMSVAGSFQVGPPTGQLVTRVKAFIEMLS